MITPAARVVRTLDQIIAWRGKPMGIRVDIGPENISGKVQTWAAKTGIGIFYIQLGKPQQNAYVERYNRTVRQEWLGHYIWNTLEEVRPLCQGSCRLDFKVNENQRWAMNGKDHDVSGRTEGGDYSEDASAA